MQYKNAISTLKHIILIKSSKQILIKTSCSDIRTTNVVYIRIRNYGTSARISTSASAIINADGTASRISSCSSRILCTFYDYIFKLKCSWL